MNLQPMILIHAESILSFLGGGSKLRAKWPTHLGKLLPLSTSNSTMARSVHGITMVAPTILPQEDVAARAFARAQLQRFGHSASLGTKGESLDDRR